MKHQLKPNTYTICESTERCKELFDWAKANGLRVVGAYEGSEYALCVNNDGTIMMLWANVGDTEIPLPEFIARLKGEWVEGKTYTQDEVIELLVAERTRARDICYAEYKEQEQSAKRYKDAGNELQSVIRGELSNNARLLGNAISGTNALAAALGETIEDRIKEQLNNQ